MNRLIIVAALALVPATALAQTTKTSWKATFPAEHKHISLESAGVYTGGAVAVNLDSLGGNMMEPNTTGSWKVIPNPKEPAKGMLIFRDPASGLRMKGPTELPERLTGTLTAMASVNQVFGPTKASVVVNATGNDGKGSTSRQGPVVRWDGAAKFLTCFVDFSTGTSYLWAGRSAVAYEALGKLIPVKGFANTKPYRVELTIIGQTARCQVFDGQELVADTGEVKDALAAEKGAAGILVEVTPTKPDQPLEGSFSEISATTP